MADPAPCPLLETTHGHHAICTCCCFLIQAGEKLGAAGVWPVRRHMAVVDPTACSLWRRCITRCPFGAVTIDHEREPRLLVDTAACYGCGLCAAGCDRGAMHRETRPTSVPELVRTGATT